MLSKKGRLLYALHTVKKLFRDAGIENAKVEVELKDGTVETIDCIEEIELFITDYINGDNNFIPSEEDQIEVFYMGRFYKASSGRILCIENDEKLTQEEVDRADELQQIAFPDEWKDQNPNDKKEDQT